MGMSAVRPPKTTTPTRGMTNMKKLLAMLAVAAFVAPAFAQDGDGVAIEGNVTLASDYSFRGWSQTQRDPAIQGGFDIAFDSGFYVGTWGSNVNFGASDDGNVASMEWDLYFGWSREFDNEVSLDLGFIHFEYPGDRDNLNYQEYAASLAVGGFTFGVNYSPEYLAVADTTFYYPYVDYSHSLTENVSLDLHLGFNQADSPGGDFFGASQGDDYIDYSASLGFPLGAAGATLSIGLYGTNHDDDDGCGRDCDLRPILSLSL